MTAARAITPAALLLISYASWAEIHSSVSLQQEAAALGAAFVGQLKPQLKQAMQSGGPGHAIEVCSIQAPGIADALSAESGWSVKRVSLKARNASRAQADEWETSVLKQFEQRQIDGEKAAMITFDETTQSRYRYMQAQGVEGVCLACHGETLAPEVAEALGEYYPDDTATGYTLGQIRGAISLTKEF